MATTVWKVVRALTGAETGRSCRVCGESIPRDNQFEFSEGVCSPCRLEPDT
jgi:predicted nucleic acid-binding Zn ribbon protein